MVEERVNEKRVIPGTSASERACYYIGTVLTHRGSLASFSTCGGLMGFIQINEDFIFIEPLNHSLAITGHAHRVYRRKRSMDEQKTTEKQASNQYCGVISDKRKSKNRKNTDSGRGKRYSYKLPQEYNVETLVVADPAMVSYHGTDAARRFILTIMNMVFNLFLHKSLGVQMNIRVTKLVLLHETPVDMYIGHHGEKMLESFCKWQHVEFGRKNHIHSDMSTSWREDLLSVDTAIFITRKDFCVHKDEPCDTVEWGSCSHSSHNKQLNLIIVSWTLCRPLLQVEKFIDLVEFASMVVVCGFLPDILTGITETGYLHNSLILKPQYLMNAVCELFGIIFSSKDYNTMFHLIETSEAS
nr:PREDICTED: A disintegrin and metalloproteinase with thrombospondin motifs 19-like [Latimeria chalumnae]|eukprot:XP_014351090.1 PREDICTED: A disintegrin and metalloproteinase with thrombospondin motifs 19-like [Latimeria chalumnae]